MTVPDSVPDPTRTTAARSVPAWQALAADWVEVIEQALAERLIEAIRRDGREDVTWQREHKQNHEDLVRIVATEDAYNAAIRTIETEVGL